VNPRLLAIFIVIVLLPLGVMSVLTVNYLNDQTIMSQVREKLLIKQQLSAVDQSVQSLLKGHERTILQENFVNLDPWVLRESIRKHVMVNQLLVLDPSKKRVFPPKNMPLSQQERDFVERTALFRQDMGEQRTEKEKKKSIQRQSKRQRSFTQNVQPAFGDTDNPRDNAQGWYVWYWESGIHLIYWWQDDRGFQFGVELSRVKLLSDVVAMLPVEHPDEFRIALLDSAKHAVYQWGGYEPVKSAADEVLSLSFPLSSWSLEYYQARKADVAVLSPFVIMLVGGGLLLLLLALYFYRESSREYREAQQRVTFVNQVSHELKTPLTNIRLYAELLEQTLDEDESGPEKQKLNIIIAESQRLSRMISNVLTFARKARNKCRFQPMPEVLDEVVKEVVEQFELSYLAKNILIHCDLQANIEVPLDRDIVEQVLGNLLSNVEKYAADGGNVWVTTFFTEHAVVLRVQDAGEGIAKPLVKHIFEPFVRGQDALTEGVSGTGIGLSIARDLMLLHQGTLSLLDSKEGALFEAIFPQTGLGQS
jgi:signal transduction histidine kinase